MTDPPGKPPPMSNTQLAVQFFLQIAVILLACRLAGVLARRLGQPQVVAEMVAGVCLGPSLLGLLFPDWHQRFFPWNEAVRDTQSYLFPVAQLGIALYMFVVGMEFRLDIVRSHWKSAFAVSVVGLVAPFLLGFGLGILLFDHTQLFPPATRRFDGAMFLGASMCITAFPMLARIIHARRLGGTRIGAIAMGAGAFNDALAWCLLAFVLASLDGHPAAAFRNIFGGLVFVAAAVFLVGPLLRAIEHRMIAADGLTDTGLAVCLALMALASFVTDALNLHAVFGAFVIGTVIPRGSMTRDAILRIQPLTVALLLPLFFTFSGLNTQLGLLNSALLWVLCGLILAAAVIGKGVACWLAARMSGVEGREAVAIGILMNTRGLMELIIINIGRERGLISSELFGMLVIMAVATTLMTTPLFDRFVGEVSD